MAFDIDFLRPTAILTFYIVHELNHIKFQLELNIINLFSDNIDVFEVKVMIFSNQCAFAQEHMFCRKCLRQIGPPRRDFRKSITPASFVTMVTFLLRLYNWL